MRCMKLPLQTMQGSVFPILISLCLCILPSLYDHLRCIKSLPQSLAISSELREAMRLCIRSVLHALIFGHKLTSCFWLFYDLECFGMNHFCNFDFFTGHRAVMSQWRESICTFRD